MLTFHLYRIKIEQSANPTLFTDRSLSTQKIVEQSILEKPSKEIRAGHIWRIGNLERIDSKALFFAFGKISHKTHEMYDEQQGDFHEENQKEAPHTYIVVDTYLQICAVAQKSRISQDTNSIAKNLAKVLEQTDAIEKSSVELTISKIHDPTEFIHFLNTAYLISSYEMTFTPPNPFDVQEQFHRPMEKLLQATKAKKGKTSIKGESLDGKTLESLTRSVASTGNRAKARIQTHKSSKPTYKSSEGNPVTVEQKNLTTAAHKHTLLQLIREAYMKVRGS